MNVRGNIPTKFALGIFRGHFRQTSGPRNFLGSLFARNSVGKFRGISEERRNSEELFPTTCFVEKLRPPASSTSTSLYTPLEAVCSFPLCPRPNDDSDQDETRASSIQSRRREPRGQDEGRLVDPTRRTGELDCTFGAFGPTRPFGELDGALDLDD
ncbi:hypothetical protein DY000_02047014 [Brassica cretica]|uniref:Uncharacterized protein n=1 Tax=Brassica cretica TaxID=69181 RepID=A0ABQ7EYH4_BRACR|nr:hypothetical protein DY000_02047014 [Brassica cretica]